MMKKLIFAVPVQPNEDGTLFIKNWRSLRLIISALKDSFEITLLVQSHREKKVSDLTEPGISVLYDNGTPEYRTDISCCPSRFQRSYFSWAGQKKVRDHEVYQSEYDCLIAWDGCSPWCLATALRLVRAKRSVVWLLDNPNLYLMRMDHSFYTDACDGFDVILASGDEVKSGLDGIFRTGHAGTLQERCIVLALPVDTSWYWEKSKQPCTCDFKADELNLLAVCTMSRESALERLPGWLAEHQEYRLPFHCYLIGDGERLDRYIQQIAIYSVDPMVTLVGHEDNPYPYIRRCDALLVSEGERRIELETAAQVFGVPMILLEELEQHLPGLSKRTALDDPPAPAWREKDKLIKILEGM